MPLESLGPDHNPKIQQLLIEEPEKLRELPFDPREYFKGEDRMHLEEKLEKKDIEFAAPALGNYVALFPEERSKFATDKWKQKLLTIIERARNGALFRDWLSIVFAFRELFPEERAVTEVEWLKVKNYFTNFNLATQFRQDAFSYLFYTSTLFPEHRNEVLWKAYQTPLPLLNPELLAKMKLTFPEKFKEVTIPKATWDTYKQDFLAESTDGTLQYLSTAFALTVLAAEEAYIDPNGEVVIHMRKDKEPGKEKVEPMPETRDF